MDIAFQCESCGQSVVIDEAGTGHMVQCPTCGHSLTLPGPAAEKVVSAPLPSPLPPVEDAKTCPYCLKTVERTAKVCRFCGYDWEWHPSRGTPTDGNSPRCPRCGSTLVSAKTRHDAFGAACFGGVLAGPMGFFLGTLLGKNKYGIKCHDCGYVHVK